MTEAMNAAQVAEAALTAARREVVRRGGHVFGAGVVVENDGARIVVYIANRELPEALQERLLVRNVPVDIITGAVPKAV
jgi:hypothetical protein